MIAGLRNSCPGAAGHPRLVCSVCRCPGAAGHPRLVCSVCRCPGAGPGPVVGMKEAGGKEQSYSLPSQLGRQRGSGCGWLQTGEPVAWGSLTLGSSRRQPLLMEGRCLGQRGFGWALECWLAREQWHEAALTQTRLGEHLGLSVARGSGHPRLQPASGQTITGARSSFSTFGAFCGSVSRRG